jgi:P27 family predicted phage terminase small subunit
MEIKNMPDPPWHLDYYAKQEWERAGPYLIEAGLLTHVDLSMFQDYCEMHAHCIRLNKKIREGNYEFVTETGYRQRTPATSIIKDFMAEKQKLANMLGLSPSARTKIEVEKPDNKKKTRDDILNSDVS